MPSKGTAQNKTKQNKQNKVYPSQAIPQKKQEDATLPNSFHKGTITLIPKPNKEKKKRKENHRLILGEYRCKNSQ